MGKNEHCGKTFDDIAVFVFVVINDRLNLVSPLIYDCVRPDCN